MSNVGAVAGASEKPLAVKNDKKPTKVEKWEFDAIGRFLLSLYHRQVVTARESWLVRKQKIRDEFKQFLALEENPGLRTKFTEKNGKCDIGSLLYRTKYLINTERGSEFYHIKYSSLFQYHNQKINEYDERQKNDCTEFVLESNSTSATAVAQSSEETQLDPALSVVFEVDENATLYPLSYEGTQKQSRIVDFQASNMGCYICQRNFDSPDKFEDHVEEHGDESDFELKMDLTKLKTPTFKLSYSICKNSHYFCFFIDFKRPDIIVEKIILVQARSFYYVNYHIPRSLPEIEQDTFFVDSHLFRMFVEQPIVIIFHDKSTRDVREIEQHHFMRIEEFPKVNLSLIPNRLPSKLLFKPKIKLSQFMPPADISTALKIDAFEGKLCEMSKEFKDYLINGKTLTQQNLREVMKLLLQVEDLDTLREYHSLIQRNAKLRKIYDEYTLKLKNPKNVTIENIISQFDEVIFLPEDTVTSSQSLEELIEKTDKLAETREKKQKVFYGQVERVSNGKITIVCNNKLREDVLFTILFRPSRLPLRYQYQALEQLNALKRSIVARYLFPDKIPCALSNTTKHLELKNTDIYNNPEQLQAVQNVVNNAGQLAPYIIFGPPGTGKTTTIVEAILQVCQLQPKSRILIMAGGNSACDEVALRLCKILSSLNQPRMIARIYSRSNEKRSDNIDELLLEYSNMYKAQFYPDVDVLHQYRIIVCTLSVVGKLASGKFGKNSVGDSIFTHIFVDEVAASTEAETLVGVLNTLGENTSLIISGDDKQLGPILNSSRAAELGLSVSLMERLLARNCYRVDVNGEYNRNIQTRLCRNFRSHPEIVQLYNRLYYNNELKALTTNDVTSLCRDWHRSPNPDYPIIFHAVSGFAQREGRSTSWYNQLELAIVMDYVKDLMYFGVNGRKIEQSDIGIISPYKKQYLRIQDELNLRHWYQIETGAVETFQGREKAIIIVSFVRSFSSSLGFLENPRRINVTLSRAKSLLILIGNPQTLSKNNDLKYVIDECHKHNTMVGASYNELVNSIVVVDNLTRDEQNSDAAKMKKLTKAMKGVSIRKKNVGADQAKKPKKWKNKKAASNKSNIATADNESQKNKNATTFKHVKPASNEKQRKAFNIYKDLYETENLNTTRNVEEKAAIDQLFNELPTILRSNQAPIKASAPLAEGAMKDSEIVQMNNCAIELSNRFQQLKLKASRTTIENHTLYASSLLQRNTSVVPTATHSRLNSAINPQTSQRNANLTPTATSNRIVNPQTSQRNASVIPDIRSRTSIGAHSSAQRMHAATPQITSSNNLTSASYSSANQRNASISQESTGNRIFSSTSQRGHYSIWSSTQDYNNPAKNPTKKSSSKCVIA